MEVFKKRDRKWDIVLIQKQIYKTSLHTQKPFPLYKIVIGI